MKLKIKPSAKIKRRYLLLKADSKNEIESAILESIGTLGWANASPVFVSSFKQSGIILSIDRKALQNVRAAFELSKNNVKILKVSGTLKGLSI